MNILFLGGDIRYRYMMSNLKEEHLVYQTGFEKLENVRELNIKDINFSKFDIVVLPIGGINDRQEIKSEQGWIYLENGLFNNINKNTIFFTGVKTKKLLEFVPESQIISFLDYEEVKKVNDTLTVDRSY